MKGEEEAEKKRKKRTLLQDIEVCEITCECTALCCSRLTACPKVLPQISHAKGLVPLCDLRTWTSKPCGVENTCKKKGSKIKIETLKNKNFVSIAEVNGNYFFLPSEQQHSRSGCLLKLSCNSNESKAVNLILFYFKLLYCIFI